MAMKFIPGHQMAGLRAEAGSSPLKMALQRPLVALEEALGVQIERVLKRFLYEFCEGHRFGIGEQMVALVKDDLQNRVLQILDDSVEREIEQVTIELHSDLSEVKTHEFESIPDAIEFLNTAELKTVFLSTDSLTVWDFPPTDEA